MAGGTGQKATAARQDEIAAKLRAVLLDHRLRVGFRRPDSPSRRLTASASLLSDGSQPTKAAKEQLTREAQIQLEAWAAYEKIAEVTTLVDGTSGLLSQCRFYPGVRVRDGDDMIDVHIEDAVGQVQGLTKVHARAAVDTFSRFTDESGAQAGLVRSASQNWSVVGRCKLVGYFINGQGEPVADTPSPDAIPDGFTEVWQAVAPTSLVLSKEHENVWSLMVAENQKIDLTKPIVYDLRWSHPRFPRQSMGWVMAALDICRDLRAFTMGQRSAARSGIPADLFLVPLEASPKRPEHLGLDQEVPEPGDDDATDDDFAIEVEEMLGEYMMDVIADTESGSGVVPAVMAVTADYIEKFDKISFSRPVDRALIELVNQARGRLAEVADCPSEMLKGLGTTNRWNGKGIAEDEYRRYFKPKADALADSFTFGPFRHGLRANDSTLASLLLDVYGVRILVDPGEAVAAPDLSKIVMGLVDRQIVGLKGARKILSIPESFAPTPAELEQMMKWKMLGKPTPADNAGRGDQGPPTDSDEPDETKGRAIVRGHVVEARLALDAGTTSLADRLFDIEMMARGGLTEACEAALDRALDRAGNKLRGWARRDAAAKRQLTDVNAMSAAEVVAALGPERCTQLADDNDASKEELWLVALAALLVAFRRIALEAYVTAQAAIGAVIPAEEIEAAIARAADALSDGMMQLADEQVFGAPGVPPPTAGEVSSLRVPSTLMRRVLAIAGGALGVGAGLDADAEAAFGLAFGPLLARITPEVADLEWVYGPAHRQQHFLPHQELSGHRFTGPTDEALAGSPFSHYPYYHPGDHRGCQCSWRPVYKSDDE